MSLPRHIAIIMDGNGRWAKNRSHRRIWGHVRGASRIKPLVRECDRLGIQALTLYAFSTENWGRPSDEVGALLKLLHKYLKIEVPEMKKENVRFSVIGDRSTWPEKTRQCIEWAEEVLSSNTGFQLNFAFSYGSRLEITSVAKEIARDAMSGALSIESITEEQIEERLWTKHLPPLDLLIRTGGEKRISNYLLWQAAYAEMDFIEKPWPEFGVADLHASLKRFSERERRFGLTSEQTKQNSLLEFGVELSS